MNDLTIGTCGLCGGRVSVPSVWMGIFPPVPKCDSCGARPKRPHGPVIEMDSRVQPREYIRQSIAEETEKGATE